MDYKNRMSLQLHQNDIVKDLDVMHILDGFYSEGGISGDDYSHILNVSDRAERTRYLLDIIIKSGSNETYQLFVESLGKDYDWLKSKLTGKNNYEVTIEDSFEDSLSRGDVPRLPDHYVERVDVAREVLKELKALTRHKILALCGMSGCGKTVIAISVLRQHHDIVTVNFNGKVFWLNFSNCKTEDDLIAQQNKLYRKASSTYTTQNSFMNSSISMSSIGSNVDSIPCSDWTWQELKDRLKLVFEEPALKDALLVLDDVNKKEYLDAFDIGCKILVTTSDTDVVVNFQPIIIKVENQLTEDESLSLLASCIDINTNKLPRQAKKIHDICKGSPFHIALIGADFSENKERLIHDNSLWNHYIKKLEKKEIFNFLTRHQYNPMKTIEVCISSLKPDILPLFKMLSVLPDNVKVSTKVLSKLWNKDVHKVENIVKLLKNKSLIIQSYDNETKNYVYEVHDIIMSYLRFSSNSEDLRRLHCDFLKSYNYVNIDNVPVDITDDGYIAYYIGYHLQNTQNLNNEWKLFNKLFLNLKFIGNKVRLTGNADVKLDLENYGKYIASDALDTDLLNSMRGYLNRSGNDLHRFPSTDIIQSILQTEAHGVLYTTAWDLAQKGANNNELYFEFLHEQDVKEINQSVIDVQEIITSVCFLGDYVLVGTNNGFIKFFHISTNELKNEIPTGTSAIKWIGACPVNPLLVASLSYEGVIKLWYIDVMEDDNDVIEEETEESFNNNYPTNKTIQSKSGPFINCCWANTKENLIAHTSDTITIYNFDGNMLQLLDNLYQDKEILCCVPCYNDKRVIVAVTNGSNRIEVIDVKTKARQAFQETDIVLSILVVPVSNHVLVLKKKEVMEYVFQTNSRYSQRVEHRKCVIKSETVKENVSFLSMVVNKTGSLLFVSTDDSRIICVDLKTYTYIFDLQNKRGNVVSMAVSEVSSWDYFEPGSDVLLSGTGTIENSAKVWYLDAPFIKQQTDKNGKVRLTTKFDASFINAVSPNTPTSTGGAQTTQNTPKRHQSFVNNKEVVKKLVRSTMSLDRHSLKPLNLKGICNGNTDGVTEPLIAVVDEKNNIQVMRGTKLLTQITANAHEKITALKISPCNHYVIYGLHTGIVKKFTIRTKDTKDIMDVNSPVEYLNYVNPNLLIVSGRNRCLMAYRITNDDWEPKMLQRGNTHLGSQEILNEIQGVKKKSGHLDNASSSSSDNSITSRDRLFPSSEFGSRDLCKGSKLVNSYWLRDIGLITIESNALVKLWDRDLKVSSVLNGRQGDSCINNCAFQKNILVLCDDYNTSFQAFQLQKKEKIELRLLKDNRLNNRIMSCALTADGNILALGLDSGDVVIWNVPKMRQIHLLKHHKSKVQWCCFSPVPERPRQISSPMLSPMEAADDEPPLVLITMGTEIVWWNITYLIKMLTQRGRYLRTGWDVVTPIASPVDPRNEQTGTCNSTHDNFFFGADVNPRHCWKLFWKHKTYKEGSKRKEILSCIKLPGIYAKQICYDDKFACFVTVDNAGHLHVMNIMQNNT